MKIRYASSLWIVAVLGLIAACGIYAVSAAERIVALTFDDGPSGAYTMRVLDILEEKGVKATFFVTGAHAEKYPDAVRREILEGHVVGNHTYSHRNLSTLDETATFNEILGTQQVIARLAGRSPKFVRYPFGVETPAAAHALQRLGLTGTVAWHNGGEPGRDDWRCKGTDVTLRAAQESTVPGAIILAHDANEVEQCSDQLMWLPRYIDWARSQGYEFGLLRTADAPSLVNNNSWVKVVRVQDAQRWNE